LPNVLCKAHVVPELIQDNATVDNLSQALLNLYRDKRLRLTMSLRLASIRSSLKQGADQLAAQTVLRLLPS
jgi:lipid-A-disaccharide synthase